MRATGSILSDEFRGQEQRINTCVTGDVDARLMVILSQQIISCAGRWRKQQIRHAIDRYAVKLFGPWLRQVTGA
jgi:hypothetical protein